jgi:anaerobic ribonucleoside-triphosphate reductase activating protein
MKIRINQVAQPITALGPGLRIAVWVQGCHIHCDGCIATDTWLPTAGYEMEVGDLAGAIIEQIYAGHLSGLTISGGEPTEQADAVTELIDLTRKGVSGIPGRESLDVLLFSGCQMEVVRDRFPQLWKQCDITVCGPYRSDLPRSGALVASSNQILTCVTELGVRRMAALDSQSSGQMQVVVDDGRVSFVGIPNPGDLTRVREALAKRGVVVAGATWMP